MPRLSQTPHIATRRTHVSCRRRLGPLSGLWSTREVMRTSVLSFPTMSGVASIAISCAPFLLAVHLLACSGLSRDSGSRSTPETYVAPAQPQVRWKLVHRETFDAPFEEPAAWVEDTYGDESPYHVDAFSDDGAFFRERGGAPFMEELHTFRSFRKSYRYGEGGWLTVELHGRDEDRDGKPESGGRFTSVSGKAHLVSARHTDAALLTSTEPLPARYRLVVTVSNVHFGGALNGSFVHNGKVNGYDGAESATPWRLPIPGEPPPPATTDNGVYFLCIVDYPHPAPHNNVFIHHHRKVVLDTDNNAWAGHSWSKVYDPALGRPVEEGSHYAGLVFLRGDDFGSERTGNEFMSWTTAGFFHEPVFADRYLDGESYRFSIERDGVGFALSIEGRFARGGLTTYRAYRTFAGPPVIWHYNQTASEGPRGRFDRTLTYQGQTTHTWPADAGYPDYLVLGDPHINYYEGSADFDDLELWLPDTSNGEDVSRRGP